MYDASAIFNRINGVCNVFKPSGLTWRSVKNALLYQICKDLNNLNACQNVEIQLKNNGLRLIGVMNDVQCTLKSNSNHLIPRNELFATESNYEVGDFRCNPVSHLGKHSSGVLIFGIGDGVKASHKMQLNKQIRVYNVVGEFGVATEDHFATSRITMKATCRHIRPERLNYIASSMQASHQRKLYEECGVDLQSQAAYEIASKGLFHPTGKTQPVIYGIKIIDFKPPQFELQIHAINETEDYFAALINDMAIELRTVAHCRSVRCIRHGNFTIESSLLRHDWNLNGILKNIHQHKDHIVKWNSSTFVQLSKT